MLGFVSAGVGVHVQKALLRIAESATTTSTTAKLAI